MNRMNIINPATEEIITTIETDTKESVKNFYLTLIEGQKNITFKKWLSDTFPKESYENITSLLLGLDY